MEFIVERPGQLLDVLAAAHPDASKRTLRKMLAAGRVLVDDEPVHAAKHEVPKGARLTILSADGRARAGIHAQPDVPDAASAAVGAGDADGEVAGQEALIGQAEAAQRARVSVVYEDRDLLVLDKPSGLLTLPLEGRDEESLRARADLYMKSRRGATIRAKRKAEREAERGVRNKVVRPLVEKGGVYPVYALEREASGLVVFGKTPDAHEALAAAWQSGELVVHHSAVVMGRVEPREGAWRAQVSESRTHQVYTTRDQQGDTQVEVQYLVVDDNPWVLAPSGDALEQVSLATTLVAFTSSSHSSAKTRAALFAVGHPVLGDRHHRWFPEAAGEQERGGQRRGGMRVPDPARRLLLHASGLTFTHPYTGEPMVVESPLPRVFRGGRRAPKGQA